MDVGHEKKKHDFSGDVFGNHLKHLRATQSSKNYPKEKDLALNHIHKKLQQKQIPVLHLITKQSKRRWKGSLYR